MMNDQEKIIWLAGILEGEGSFGYSKNSPWIHLMMTDRDIIVRASEVMGCSHAVLTRKRGNYKTSWQISTWGMKTIILMKKILPYMGDRRTAKINEVISLWDARKLSQKSNEKRTARLWQARRKVA